MKWRSAGPIPAPGTVKALPSKVFTYSSNIKGPKKGPTRFNVLLTEFKKNKLQSMLPLYKSAQLYSNSTKWYIFYSFLSPVTGKYQRFKEYFDINRIKSQNDRIIYANEVINFLNQKLSSGFNPFKKVRSSQINNNERIGDTILYLHSLICSQSSKETIRTYVTMKGRLERFLKEEKLTEISILQFDIALADSFKGWMLKSLSKKTINSTLSHLAQYWTIAIAKNVALSNPFKNIEKVKRQARGKQDGDVFEPLTYAEMDKIVNAMQHGRLRNYLRFLAMILYAWARPVEICRLRIGQIDLERDMIKFKKGSTKNDAGGFVQIVPQLKRLLIEMNLSGYPSDYYLFSTIDYLPGEKQKDPERATEAWKLHVNKKLEINKRMYALKHTGNIEYLLRNKGNVDLKWQQMQNRHSSSAMTEKYNRKLGAYFIDCKDLFFREM